MYIYHHKQCEILQNGPKGTKTMQTQTFFLRLEIGLEIGFDPFRPHLPPPNIYVHCWKAMDHGYLLTLSIHLAGIPTSPQNFAKTLGLK